MDASGREGTPRAGPRDGGRLERLAGGAYARPVPAPALAAVLAALAGAAGGSPDASDVAREAMARRVVALGRELRRAVEAGDAGAVLARVPPEGLACGDRTIPRARVERDLRTSRSWLHRTLFERGGGEGSPASLREFFLRADRVTVEVAFEPDPAAGPIGRACLSFRAGGLPSPVLPLCFFERGGRLWLTQSPYPCG